MGAVASLLNRKADRSLATAHAEANDVALALHHGLPINCPWSPLHSAALRPPLGFAVSGAGLLMFSLAIAFSLIEFLLDRVAVVTVITPVGRNIKTNLPAITPMRRNSIMVEGNWRAQSLF
jgi:hypothetical protein